MTEFQDVDRSPGVLPGSRTSLLPSPADVSVSLNPIKAARTFLRFYEQARRAGWLTIRQLRSAARDLLVSLSSWVWRFVVAVLDELEFVIDRRRPRDLRRRLQPVVSPILRVGPPARVPVLFL